MDPASAIERLKAGNRRFREDRGGLGRRDRARRDELVAAQAPFAAVLCCSDSRVVPEFIFDTGLGDLFVARVAGNGATPGSIASLEFAVDVLGTRLVVVLAHESCGAMEAALEGSLSAQSEYGHQIFELARQALATAPPDVDAVARANAALTAEELVRRSAVIRELVDRHGGRVVPAFYRLSGAVVAV